jgi:hypothetical protein
MTMRILIVMALRSGSFYTEPSGVAHFAETKAEPVEVYITGDCPFRYDLCQIVRRRLAAFVRDLRSS